MCKLELTAIKKLTTGIYINRQGKKFHNHHEPQ